MNTITFKNCKNIKTFFNPYTGKIESIEFLQHISLLPSESEINFETNPRKQNYKTRTYQKIENSLFIPDRIFHKKNKGILFSAKDVNVNTQKNIITATFEDDSCHGLCDGAHSYKAVLRAIDKAKKKNLVIDHYMKIEIMIGIEDIFEDVVAARNSSVQVSDAAIAELKEQFDFIKEFISSEYFADKISFKDNELSDITIKDIISILFIFNIDRYPNDINCPTQSFNASSSCLSDFLKMYKELDKITDKTQHIEELKKTPYYRMKNVIVDFFKLYDKIQEDLPKLYHQATNRHLGNLSCVKVTNCKSTFYNNNISCNIPKAFILPILGSFRALLTTDESNFYKWVADPFKYLNDYGPQLASEMIERYIELKSTTSLGRNIGVWRQLYRIIQMKYIINK